MRSQPPLWSRLLATLGITRKKRPSHTPVGYRRNLRFEQCEDRRRKEKGSELFFQIVFAGSAAGADG